MRRSSLDTVFQIDESNEKLIIHFRKDKHGRSTVEIWLSVYESLARRFAGQRNLDIINYRQPTAMVRQMNSRSTVNLKNKLRVLPIEPLFGPRRRPAMRRVSNGIIKRSIGRPMRLRSF